MSRTINGNCTGRAARTPDYEGGEFVRTPQDVRIGRKKGQLERLMGDDFMSWYKTTAFHGDTLERQLDEKLVELAPVVFMDADEFAGVDVDRFLAIMVLIDLPKIVVEVPPEPETRWEFPWVDDLKDLHETQEDALDRGLQ